MTLRSLDRLVARLSNARHGNEGADFRDLTESVYSDWTTWSPTVANFTVGTGGNAGVTARYTRFGQTVICSVAGVLGTTGEAVGGSVTITLPLTATALPTGVTRVPVGQVIFGDSGVAAYYGSVNQTSTTLVALQLQFLTASFVTLGNISSTTPFTWADDDWFTAVWVYEIPEP